MLYLKWTVYKYYIHFIRSKLKNERKKTPARNLERLRAD